MKSLKRAGLALALTGGLSPLAWGQGVPGAPVAGGPAGAPAVTAAGPGIDAAPAIAGTGPVTPAAAGQPRNLWSFLMMTPEQKAMKKEKFCKSTFAKFMSNAMAPARVLSGGMLGGCCPPALPSELAMPADSAEGAAARIKQDEANAKKRRADVRYLGTVDCRYWPEAKEALINSLRADRNECVRFEAALAFQRGCCCNKDTIRALTIAVNCSDEDGNPREASSRVREAAMHALQHCVDTYCEVASLKPVKPGVVGPGGPPVVDLPPPRVEPVPVPMPVKPVVPVDPPIEGKGKGKDKDKDKDKAPQERSSAKETAKPQPPRNSIEYYQRVRATSWDRIIADAKAALAKHPVPTSTTASSQVGHSLTEVVSRSLASPLPGEGPKVVIAPSAPAAVPTLMRVPGPAPVTTSALPRPLASPTITTPAVTRPAPSVPVSTPVFKPATSAPAVTKPAAAPMPAGPVTPPPLPVTVPAAKTQTSVVPAFTPTTTPSAPPVVRTTFAPTATTTPEVRPAFAPTVTTAPARTADTPTGSPYTRTASTGSTTTASPYQTTTRATTTANTTTPYQSTTRATTTANTTTPYQSTTTTTVTFQPKERLLVFFHNAVELQHRQWAATQLGLVPNGGSDDQVVAALLKGAEKDSAAVVRVACLESLQKQKVTHSELSRILPKLQADPDVRVRQAAVEASNVLLKGGASGPYRVSSLR